MTFDYTSPPVSKDILEQLQRQDIIGIIWFGGTRHWKEVCEYLKRNSYELSNLIEYNVPPSDFDDVVNSVKSSRTDGQKAIIFDKRRIKLQEQPKGFYVIDVSEIERMKLPWLPRL